MRQELLKKPEFPFEVLRGERIYRNTGELCFETRPREAGTFPVIFLEWVPSPRWAEVEMEIMLGHNRANPHAQWWAKIINERGRIEVVHPTLVSRYNV
jgi:hypothetical protein